MQEREVKVGDRFDGCEVLGNRRWVEGCRGWVWDVRNPERITIDVTETAIHQYMATKPPAPNGEIR